MKDARVTVFRTALDGLLESLDATVRVTRWVGDERAPEPLQQSASQLVARLGAAGRLASAHFSGSPADTARVNAMINAMRRLDAAYVSYRRQLDRRPQERESAATALGHELDAVKAEATWTA